MAKFSAVAAVTIAVDIPFLQLLFPTFLVSLLLLRPFCRWRPFCRSRPCCGTSHLLTLFPLFTRPCCWRPLILLLFLVRLSALLHCLHSKAWYFAQVIPS